ncbi:MAG TPA: phosphatase PAP2 family protein [Planctomycetota bacterium]|nr:phosphatase PAP2 family protein [Planctomycetota bacterium]
MAPLPPAPSPTLPRRWLALDVIASGFVGATILVVLLNLSEVPGAPFVIAGHVALLAVYALLRWGAAHRPRLRTAFIVYLFAFVLAIFQAMGLIIKHVRGGVVMDPALAVLDVRLFGSDPTRWLEPFLNPWTTLVLEICYSSYFFLPVLLTVLVLRQRRYADFLSYAATIVGCFFTTYVGYYLVPAYGPRAHVAYETPLPLGDVAAALYRVIDWLDYIRLNAFPSGHTAVSLVCLAILWRESRRAAAFSTPLVAGLILATLAHRYHYMIDVVAGVLVAMLWVPFGMRLVFRFDRRGEPRAGAPGCEGAPGADA